jgi:hypothetical protein
MKKQTYTAYAIMHKDSQTFLEVSATGNGDAEFCGSYSAELSPGGKNPLTAWTTGTYEGAMRVVNDPPKWYNTGLETPQHRYKKSELVVVEITATIS